MPIAWYPWLTYMLMGSVIAAWSYSESSYEQLMARTRKTRRDYDDDYDNSKSYDDYDYGRVEGDAVSIDDSDDYNQEQGRSLIWIAFNNTALFMIAYVLQWFTYQAATSGIAYRRFMNSIIRYHITNVTPVGGRWYNNIKTIVWIYTSGPVACFALGAFALILYYRYFHKSTTLFRPFLIWLFTIGAVLSIGAVAAGILVKEDYRGIGYAIAWSGNRTVTRYIYLGITILLMLLVGFLLTKPILQTATSAEMIRRRGGARSEYLLFAFIIPAGLGGLLVSIFRLPGLEYYDVIALLMLIPTMLAMLSYSRQISTLRIIKSLEEARLSKFTIVLAFTLLITLRFVLDPGIRVSAFDPQYEAPGSVLGVAKPLDAPAASTESKPVEKESKKHP